MTQRLIMLKRVTVINACALVKLTREPRRSYQIKTTSVTRVE